jgi:hypothetical protein
MVITAVALSALIAGCGGGSGGGAEVPVDLERDQAFREEAVRVAVERVVMTCETLECPTADEDIDATAIPGSGEFTHFCSWDCIAATLPRPDGSLETRHHLVQLDWDRLEGDCWAVDDPIVITANLNAFSCTPN